MAGLTWAKAAGGGTGAFVAAYIVDILNDLATTYLANPMPEVVQFGLLGLITGIITYFAPANAQKPVPTPDVKSGV